MGTLNTHLAQLVRARCLYHQGQGFKSFSEYMGGLKIKRICKGCGKEFDALAIKVRQGKGLFCCKGCYNQYRKLNSYDPKERNKLYQKKTKYGLSEEEYKHLFVKQNNKCAICGESFNSVIPVVDHNHNTGIVRGLLCSKCNTLLGMAKDNISILENAIIYLKKR